MQIVILGANGYLGNRPGKYLREQGNQVYDVCRSDIEIPWANES